jgi:uncharacterized membrane protein YdjX (TVP38/TMEM64 family)
MIVNKMSLIAFVKKRWASILAFILIIGAIVFLYLDKGNDISALIQGAGLWGVVLAILLMALIFMVPVPSEGLVIVILKIYGVYYGLLFSWIGSIIGSLALFYIARYFRLSIIKNIATQNRLELVNTWVVKGGIPGLIVARFLPLPTFFANFLIGLMPTITAWYYIWTAAVAIIPYCVTMGLLYTGVEKGSLIWLIPGVIIAIVSVTFGFLTLKKHKIQEQ